MMSHEIGPGSYSCRSGFPALAPPRPWAQAQSADGGMVLSGANYIALVGHEPQLLVKTKKGKFSD